GRARSRTSDTHGQLSASRLAAFAGVVLGSRDGDRRPVDAARNARGRIRAFDGSPTARRGGRMSWRVVKQVARTAFVEFWRSPAAVFWTYGFPLMMALVLGFAFQPSAPKPVPVAVVQAPGAGAVVAGLGSSKRLAVELLPAEQADQALARGRVALLIRVEASGPVLRSDPTRPEAELARLLVERALHGARTGDTMTMAAEVEDRPG